MKPLYLKFESEAQAKAILFADIPHPEFGPVTVANFANIEVIGTLYRPTGETFSDGDIEAPAMEPIPGWHVNVMLLDSEDGSLLEPFAVAVKSPSRVWAQ